MELTKIFLGNFLRDDWWNPWRLYISLSHWILRIPISVVLMRSNCIVFVEVKQLSPKSFKGVLFLSGPILPCVVLPSVPSGSGLARIYGSWGAALATFRFWAYFISANTMEWMTDLLHLRHLLLALWIRLLYNLYARPLLWSALTSGFRLSAALCVLSQQLCVLSLVSVGLGPCVSGEY